MATSIAHYRITSKLGEGGMGAVYRATDTKLNREVAIKILPDSFASDRDRLARFTREAQVLASLNHPNIATIHGVEERALIMELVEGVELAGPMAVGEALPIIHQLIDALEYAHEKGIVHRDLKPANIKLTPEGRVKVLDFGLAKAIADDLPASDSNVSPTLTVRATVAGVIMGTAAYMSPEQARGQVVDKRSDIWSFGVLVFELLTGRRLFEGPSVSDTLASVLKETPDWDSVPQELRGLVKACLARDARQRLRDIGDARLMIAQTAVPAATTPPPELRGYLRWWSIAASILALAGLAVAVVHFLETLPELRPVRFQIPAPEKSDYATGGLALSPDGRKLAFIATGPSRQSMLWVRSLDGLESRALPGTEGAGFLPFWSPDSRFIAFGVQGRLKKIEATGGPAETLCEIGSFASPILGGSWNREGILLFGNSSGGIYRVSQAGGVATRLTTADESRGEFGHLRPWFLPDGRHFIYVTRAANMNDNVVYLASLDSPDRKPLLKSRQAAAYVPAARGSKHGHLLFLRESTLMAQPMDEKRYELAGDPFPVAEQVGSALQLGFFAASATGVLAYRSGLAGGGASRLVWMDRSGKTVADFGIGAPDSLFNGSLALSPDGRRLAIQQTVGGNRDIWLLDLERGTPTRFTFDAAQDHDPVWTTDGSRVLYGSDRGGIYQKAFSGAGSEGIVGKPATPMRPLSMSRDGRRLLCETTNSSTTQDLWVLPASGASGQAMAYLQTPFSERQGQFSPDGRWVAYISNESGATFGYHVYVQSFPAGAGKFQISSGIGGTQPRWSRDGRELFYMTPDGKLMAVDVNSSPGFEHGSPRELFDARVMPSQVPGSIFRYDVASDGKRFLVNTFSAGGGGEAAPPVTVVLNWLSVVRK